MPTTVALVSCVKSKRDTRSSAADLYTSPLFRRLRAHAERHADAWFILSARHGLLDPAAVVDPYEQTLNKMSRPERVTWAEGVQQQLLDVLPTHAHVIMLAGTQYREHLMPFLKDQRWDVTVPLEGLRMGQQLKRLNELAAAGRDAR